MTSGEPDYTQRTRILQHITADVHSIVEGIIDGAVLAEEGTETSAAGYTGYVGATVADEAVITTEGANSLEYTIPGADVDCGAGRNVTAIFKWGDFVSLSVQTYRPANNFDLAGEGIWIVFQPVDLPNSITSNGKGAFIPLDEDTAATWTTHTLNKGDFSDWGAGITDAHTIAVMMWITHATTSTVNDVVYLDDHDVTVGSPTTKPFLVDADGRLQVDVATIAAGTNNIGDVDVVSTVSIPAGTNAIGSVEVTDISEIGDFYSANVVGNGETILISPGVTEKVKVSYIAVSCYTDDTTVDIREQDNDTNKCFYDKMKEGKTVNANLIGHEYITSTVNKDLEINTDQVCDLYVVIGYELI